MNLTSWDKTAEWLDNQNITYPLSYMSEAITGGYAADAFSLGQLASKVWMISELKKLNTDFSTTTCAILGSWIGSAVPLLCEQFNFKRIYGFDAHSDSISQSEVFNRRLVEKEWAYKGVVCDVNYLNISEMQFVTNGELIELTPGVVINTSCEHMEDDWFGTIAPNQLVIIQSNNNPDFDGHHNICESLDHFNSKYPLNQTLYSDEMILPIYTRFMKIGFK